jgi:hypothetical protein
MESYLSERDWNCSTETVATTALAVIVEVDVESVGREEVKRGRVVFETQTYNFCLRILAGEKLKTRATAAPKLSYHSLRTSLRNSLPSNNALLHE